MFGKIFKLLRSEEKPRPRRVHPQLGELIYSFSENLWETVDDSEIYHGGISGSEEAPDESAIQEILGRLNNIDAYRDACSEDLRFIAESFESVPKGLEMRDLYRIAAVSLYEDYWEVCFVTKPEYKWIYVGMQFEGEKLVSNTIDT